MTTQVEKSGLTICRYGCRNWAVYDEAKELVCVTVYKKGAQEVVRRLSAQTALQGLGMKNFHKEEQEQTR